MKGLTTQHRRSLQPAAPQAAVLQAPLLQLTPTDALRVVDVVQNISVMGQPGSGKTSSMAALARALLLHGTGMLVLCAKADERVLWERYCHETGRSGSLIIFDGKQHRYNFIAAQLARYGLAGINVIIDALMYVLEAARALSGSVSKGDVFWEDIVRVVLRHVLPMLYLATNTITIADIIALVRSAPRTPADMSDAEWQRQSFFFRCMQVAFSTMNEGMRAQVISFWRDEWMSLDPKTRSNASMSLTTTLDRFNHGWLREAFCTDTTMTPELLMHAAVIVLDMPALTHLEDGILAQRLMKFDAQRVLLARQSYGPQHSSRLVTLWMDEAHQFIDKHDAKFMSLSRSAMCSTVLMAQSLPTYYAVMGGENARDRVDMLLANCATKIWFSNSCPITNKAAAETLGQVLHRRANFSEGSGYSENEGRTSGMGENWGSNSSVGFTASHSSGPNGGSSSSGVSSSVGGSEGSSTNVGRSSGSSTSSNVSNGWSEQLSYALEPAEFGRLLKTGGPANGFRTSAVWYQAGRRFVASGGPTIFVEFQQS